MAKINNFKLLVGDNADKPSACARNRRVNFDSTQSFKTFINDTAAGAMYHIRTLAAIDDHFPREITTRLHASMVKVDLIIATLCSRAFLNTLCAQRTLLGTWQLAFFSRLGVHVKFHTSYTS